MAAFNDDLQRIGSETKALQAIHLTAKTRLRQEEQKLESLKDEIAEQTTNRDVSLLLPLSLLAGSVAGVTYCMTKGKIQDEAMLLPYHGGCDRSHCSHCPCYGRSHYTTCTARVVATGDGQQCSTDTAEPGVSGQPGSNPKASGAAD